MMVKEGYDKILAKIDFSNPFRVTNQVTNLKTWILETISILGTRTRYSDKLGGCEIHFNIYHDLTLICAS